MCTLAAMRRSSVNPLFSEIRQSIYSQRKGGLRFGRVYFLKMQKCLFHALTYALVCLHFLNKRKSQHKMAFNGFSWAKGKLVWSKSWGFAVILSPLQVRAWKAPGGHLRPVSICPASAPELCVRAEPYGHPPRQAPLIAATRRTERQLS